MSKVDELMAFMEEPCTCGDTFSHPDGGDANCPYCAGAAKLRAELVKLQGLVKQGEAVVNDFMPNVGKCALQDYGRLNDFLVKAAQVETEN